LLKFFGVAPEAARVDCADDDGGGAARPRGIGDARDRGVGAEVDDAPAAGAQCESEGEEAEVVLFSGGAGEDCDRPDAAAPAACQPEEAPTKQRGGEVFLRDRYLAAFPAHAEPVQVGDDDVSQERVDRKPREQRVEDCVGVAVVEARQCSGELVLRGRGSDLVVPASCRSGGQGSGLGGGVTICEVLLHRLHAGEIVRRVQPQSTGRAGRLQQPIPPFPGAQQLGTDARAATQLSDPQCAGRFHAWNIQHLYRSLTIATVGDKVTDLYKLYTGGEQR
jgi:hypothetical protein